MELKWFEEANIAEEIKEIKKFENNTEVEGFVSITALCSEFLTIICC